MSRIGKMPITLTAGVQLTVAAGNEVTVKGPVGTLTAKLCPEMVIKKEDNVVTVECPNEAQGALHGLTRALLHNMVEGATHGFSKELEINGVGYKAAKQGKQLVLNLGYSHTIVMEEPAGITYEVPAPNKIIIKGADKQKVGQLAAEIRGKRPPEPYLGKGVKYVDETIRRKAGKSGK